MGNQRGDAMTDTNPHGPAIRFGQCPTPDRLTGDFFELKISRGGDAVSWIADKSFWADAFSAFGAVADGTSDRTHEEWIEIPPFNVTS